MGARRLGWTVMVLLCGCVGALAGVVPGVAGATQFGEEGTGAGQFRVPWGVAVDNGNALGAAYGDVYVADRYNYRIARFDGSGNFQFAWGWRVNLENPVEALQTCTVLCEKGSEGSGAGQYPGEGPQSLAADSGTDLSAGDVYVVDWQGFRVQKFDAEGKFLLMFGGEVNVAKDAMSGASEAEKNVCVAGEACKEGIRGTGSGQFEWPANAHGNIAVGPQGRVYVGDRARIEVFESSGVWRENISLLGLSSSGGVRSLAVDSAGDMFVKDEGVSGVRELEPSGLEGSAQFDAGSESVEALAFGASGNLLVADSNGGLRVLAYDSAGNELDAFGQNTLEGASSMAFSNALGELYVSYGHSVSALAVPQPGPWVSPGSEKSIPEPRGAATLEAVVDPEGHATEVEFEYVDEAQFNAAGYAGATRTSAVAIGSSFEDQPVNVHLSGLRPGAVYHYRVAATDSANHTIDGLDQSFEETPAALVEGPFVTNVASTSATLSVRIDPLGTSTGYRLEYGTSNSYGHVWSGSVGEGMGYVPISRHIQELEPQTTYHYRLITVSAVRTIEGRDHTFTTQIAGGNELTLPDGRAWELVSPPNKQGALIQFPLGDDLQAAGDGHGITYGVSAPLGENPVGNYGISASQVFSVRGSDGWSTQDIAIQQGVPNERYKVTRQLFSYFPTYLVFSSDLSVGGLEPGFTARLSPGVTERTLYLRNDLNGSFSPLVSAENVPAGTKFGGREGHVGEGMKLSGATPDLSHVVLESQYALTPEAKAVPGPAGCPGETANASESGECRKQENLYEWSAGKLKLVNIKPDGSTEPGAFLGRGFVSLIQTTAHAVSDDGRWIVWGRENFNFDSYFLRDMVAGRTVPLGIAGSAAFQMMSGDGSKAFFLEHGELYDYEHQTGTQSDLTAGHGAGERSAGVKDAVMGASEDGSYVYFVATGVLANGAVRGADNLYLLHDEGNRWTTTYVATLSPDDEKDWFYTAENTKQTGTTYPEELLGVTSRVSPGGRYLAFMSDRPLTGYDNLDANSGQPDEEVYLYDAVAGHLVCASCNPTGARPVGLSDGGGQVPLIDSIGLVWPGRWLAGSVPGWDATGGEFGVSLYQPRYLSDSGRLFFDSSDALVPQDTNGLEDVYEYEPTGVGSCTSAHVTFNGRSDGCMNLISSGTSGAESAFYDASENGNDVFFTTLSKLSALDYDTAYDVYDAHVCSTSVPCVSPPVSPPPCTSGDSCKVAPSPQPAIFGPAPSATFSGTGNVVGSPAAPVVTKKSLTRAQRLARALRACRAESGRKRRAACERQARNRYRAKQARKAKTIKRGNG
jgi:hypothetical protein